LFCVIGAIAASFDFERAVLNRGPDIDFIECDVLSFAFRFEMFCFFQSSYWVVSPASACIGMRNALGRVE